MFVSNRVNSFAEFHRGCNGSRILTLLVPVAMLLIGSSPALAQVVRTKKPDRGVYRPPVIDVDPAIETAIGQALELPQADDESSLRMVELIRGNGKKSIQTASLPNSDDLMMHAPVANQPEQPRGGPLYEASLDEVGASRHVAADTSRSSTDSRAPQTVKSGLQRVNHDEVILKRPQPQTIRPQANQPLVNQSQANSSEPASWDASQVTWEGSEYVVTENGGGIFDPSCGSEGSYCDSGCVVSGCDSMGCSGCSSCCNSGLGCAQNGRLCFNRNEWFGSAELLLMFRDGVRLPNLVTTGPSTDAGTAGEIGQATTQFLVGNNTGTFDDMSVGGRLTLGTWLDSQRCRSLVGRGWYGGRNTFDFSTSNIQTPVIVRPFFNVSDGQTAAQDNNLVAFPGRSNGDISVSADSSVYGADLSVRQFWAGGLGATIDVLYGYQYMSFDESLSISTNSVAIAVPNTPVGTVQSVSDNFSADNQFHGGQFGVAMHYEENCWTFRGLIKSGFGSLRRTADLSGQTTTTVGNDVATTAEGFLVQSTNSGKRSDSTFGWVPELDLTLGWHRYPRFDVTAGYHVIAMTDALRVFDTVDSDLAINSSANPTGQQRPSVVLDYGTFFVHGIHFGLQYRY